MMVTVAPVAPRTSWAAVDLSPHVLGISDANLELPTVFCRVDGVALFYAGKVNGAHGETESCKSLAMKIGAGQELGAGNHVLYIDFEDSAGPVVATLLDLGVPADAILERFHYHRPTDPLTAAGFADIEDSLAFRPTLAIVDGVTEAMASFGFDPNDNMSVARFHALLPRRLADSGAATVTIDHVTKSSQGRGRFAIGAQHKLATIDGAAYAFEVVEPFVRGGTGKVRVIVAKDRPGYVRQHAAGKVIAELHLRSDSGGNIAADLIPPNPADRLSALYDLKRQISLALETRGDDGLNAREIRGAVRGASDAKSDALKSLVKEGYVALQERGRSHLYTSTRPYRPDGGR